MFEQEQSFMIRSLKSHSMYDTIFLKLCICFIPMTGNANAMAIKINNQITASSRGMFFNLSVQDIISSELTTGLKFAQNSNAFSITKSKPMQKAAIRVTILK